MQVSTSTSMAPTNSVTRPISLSAAKAVRRRPRHDMPIPMAAAAGSLMFAARARSGQGPGVFFQQCPGFVAHLLLDVGIEPGLPQRLLKRLGVGLVKGQPALGH